MTNIVQNIKSINSRLQTATQNAGRDPKAVTLLAVSKKQPESAIRTAYACGLRRFGENYLQEALEKQSQLADLNDIEWHFIGPVQSNKTRNIAENFDWLHTIDRIKIAERLSKQRPATMKPLNVCLQVNIDNEPSKSGVLPNALTELASATAALPNLNLRGLMAIPRASNCPNEQRRAFRQLAELLTALQARLPQLTELNTLSMGMSGDLEAAIAEGATLIRIGTDIFGTRN